MTSESENLFSRFVFDSDKINNNRVHFKAFQPPKDMELSVQKNGKLKHDEIRDIGEDIAKKRNQSLKGWGEIKGQAFLYESLDITVDNNPNKGHTKITGWPDTVERQENIMKNLAARSRPVLVESNAA
ncbi:MAG: hypothetical protein OXC62_02350 [Aestuariivita sp.]|nr:hypothetical protein [Aestuariivita sp.]